MTKIYTTVRSKNEGITCESNNVHVAADRTERWRIKTRVPHPKHDHWECVCTRRSLVRAVFTHRGVCADVWLM